MESMSNEYVSVLVPKRHLAKVYGLIATLEGESDISPEVATATETKEDGWTPELIRRQFEESPETIQRFQRLLADHQDEWLSTSDIATALNAQKGSKTIAGALGAYGRRVSNRYSMKTWPFANKWLHTEGQQSYCMSPEVADIIKPL
jgi:hypothetical protein